MRAVRSIWKKE